jgi:hypothetical protein
MGRGSRALTLVRRQVTNDIVLNILQHITKLFDKLLINFLSFTKLCSEAKIQKVEKIPKF